MALDNLVAAAKANPEEVFQLLAAAGGTIFTMVGFATGGGWWLANTLAKNQLEILQARRELAQDSEKVLKTTIETLKAEMANQPASLELASKARDVDIAFIDLEATRKTVGDAYAGMEHVVSSVWNGLASIFENDDNPPVEPPRSADG